MEESKSLSKREKTPRFWNGSDYDDTVGKHLAFNILYYVMGLLSATLLSPLTVYLSAKRSAEHTIINGRRLAFDGKICQIYLLYLKLVGLSLATLFIYTFFINGQIRKWVAKHTYFADEINPGSSRYTGNGYESLVVNVVTMVVRYGTFGILAPRAEVVHQEMMTKRYTYSGHHLIYVGAFSGVMGFGLRNILLTICTLGFYQFFKDYELTKWNAERTIIDDGRETKRGKSKMYSVIDYFMAHKALIIGILALLIAGALTGIICFYVYWKGTFHGFIVFAIASWLVIYSAFFAPSGKK